MANIQVLQINKSRVIPLSELKMLDIDYFPDSNQIIVGFKHSFGYNDMIRLEDTFLVKEIINKLDAIQIVLARLRNKYIHRIFHSYYKILELNNEILLKDTYDSLLELELIKKTLSDEIYKAQLNGTTYFCEYTAEKGNRPEDRLISATNDLQTRPKRPEPSILAGVL